MNLKELDEFITTYQLKDIAHSLNELSNKSWFWDLLVPIFIAGLVAYVSARLTFRYTRKSNNDLIKQQQNHFNLAQKIIRENQNREVINHTVLTANNCINEIISIKDNYRGTLAPNLYITERMLIVPDIAGFDSSPLDLSFINRLTFILPSDPDITIRWKQPSALYTLFSNYNNMLKLWEQRNELKKELHTYINNNSDYDNFVNLTPANPVPQKLFDRLAQLTEILIGFTDDLGYQFHKFLDEFEEAYSDCIDKEIDKSLLHKIVRYPASHNIDRLALLAYSLPPSRNALNHAFRTSRDIDAFLQKVKSPYRVSSRSI